MSKLLLDAFFYSLMVGAGETYFAAYSLSLGHSELQAGALLTLPIVFGGMAQLLSPFILSRVKSYKPIVLSGVFGQILCLCILIFFEKWNNKHYSFLFIIVTIYWIMAMGITPAWNSWISKLIKPEEVRHFFSLRNSYIGIGTLFGLFIAGLSLQYKIHIFSLSTFQLIFLICFLARSLSFIFLAWHPRVQFVQPSKMNFSLKALGQNEKEKFLHQFFIFSSIFKIGVFFSAAFFTPYMLMQLKFSYLEYTIILIASFIGRVFIGYYLKKRLAKFDINLLYLISACGISLIPILWPIFGNVLMIFFLELFTGIMWGTFDICFFITVFEEIPTEKQSVYMTRFNFWHTLAMGVGSLLGIICFFQFKNYSHIYFIVFGISTLLRALAIFTFPRRHIKTELSVFSDFFRSLAIRPGIGIITRPMWQLLKFFKKD